jgi:hypothetical protein
MKYKPELGFFGNLERAFAEMTKTNNQLYKAQNDLSTIDQRVKFDEEVNNITFVALAETKVLDDNTAARHANVFPQWAVGVSFAVGHMRQDPETGGLYRCNQAHTSVAGWEPHLTPALWTVVDVTHAGTREDPIPAEMGMEFTYGLYYLDPEDSKLYLCKRQGEADGGKITLYFLPHQLVGQYFEEVQPQ